MPLSKATGRFPALQELRARQMRGFPGSGRNDDETGVHLPSEGDENGESCSMALGRVTEGY